MRKFASVSVLILVAYIAGAVRHFETDKAAAFTDKVVAFVAPAVPHVTAAGDAVWSVVRSVGDVFTANPQPRAFMTDAPPFVVAAVKMAAKNLYVRAVVYEYSWQSIAIAAFAWSWLIVGLVWAVIATPTPWGAYPFPSMVGYIWVERPEVDGQRTLPLWMAVLILPAAVFEFGARNCYFVGYTVVTLIVVPLKVLKGLLTFDLSRLVPPKKPKPFSRGTPPVFNTSHGTCVDCGPYRWNQCGEIVHPKDCEFKDRYDHNL